MVDSERVQTRARMTAGVHRTVERLGAPGVRRVGGTSLVAMLCASALAPLAAAGLAVGPVTLAAVGVVGAVGAGKLTEVVDSALEALRGGAGEGDEQAVEKELVEHLERALSGSDASSAAVREAAAELLRGLDVVHGLVAEGLAGLSVQFTEFAFVAQDIRAGVLAIETSMREQSAVSEQAREELYRLTLAVESSQAGGAGLGEGLWAGCPYLGLVAYGPGDARVFFGRSQLTFDLQHKLLVERLGVDGPLVVTGPSGAGKSSLVRAGLLPALARGEVLPATRGWPCRVITPNTHPLRELSAVLAEVCGRSARAVYDLLSLEPARAAGLVSEALARQSVAGRRASVDVASGGALRLVLVVDQFEELFTQVVAEDADGRAERDAFLAALEALARPDPARTDSGRAPGLVLAAVRGDFLDQSLDLLSLSGAGEAGLFRVGSMTAAQLGEAITGPAAEAGLGVEPELVEELVREARERPDALALGTGVLPLVSQVMARVWEQREGGNLTVRGYRRAGGLAEAVNRDAAEAYGQLDPDGRQVARAVFLRLTLMTGEGRAARRRAGREELYQAAGGRRAEVDRLVEVFAARRLLVLEDDRVEISHEALFQAWGMLQGWLDEDRGDHVVYGRLSADAESWQQRGEDPAYLYQGGRLQEVAEVQARWATDPERYPVPAPAVTQFLGAGRAAQKTRVRRRRRTLIGLVVLAVVATGTALGAGIALEHVRQDDAAVRAETSVAVSRELAAEALNLATAAPYTADQLDAAAWATSPSPNNQAAQAGTTLLNEQAGMLVTPAGLIDSVAFNTAGTMLASAGTDGTVRLWNPATEQQIGAPIMAGTAKNPAGDVAFNRAGTILATTDGGGTVSLWNPANQRRIGTITAITGENYENGVNDVAFDPAGTILATADTTDGTVSLWNPTTQKRIGTITPTANGSVDNVAFNPTGTILATADDYDGTVSLWNPTTQKRIGTITPTANGGIDNVAFNPTGTILATTDGGGTVSLWNPTTRKRIGTITAPATTDGNDVYVVAFNPAGTILAIADYDGTVSLWNPTTQKRIATITSTTDENGFNGVAFDPAGTILATADNDGTVSLWNPTTQKHITTTIATTDENGVDGVAFNPTGTILATADYDGTVSLWNPTTRKHIATITATTNGSVDGVTFNSTGTILATADNDEYSTVTLWNPTTQKHIATIDTLSGGTIEESPFYGVAFNPTGTILATVNNDDSTVSLWNPTTQKHIGTITSTTGENGVDGVAFDPAGTILATADNDGTVTLWNPTTQKQIGTSPPTTSEKGVDGVTFNPAGTILATVNNDGIDLINMIWQLDGGSALCHEFDLPSRTVWNQYAGTALTEPAKCS